MTQLLPTGNFNSYLLVARLFLANLVNIMAVDDLAPSVARSSAAMISTMQNWQFLLSTTHVNSVHVNVAKYKHIFMFPKKHSACLELRPLQCLSFFIQTLLMWNSCDWLVTNQPQYEVEYQASISLVLHRKCWCYLRNPKQVERTIMISPRSKSSEK